MGVRALASADAGTEATPAASAEVETDDESSSAIHQTPEEGFEEDSRLMAEELGLDLAEVQTHLRFVEEFRAEVAELRSQYADRIAAVWVDRVPGTRGHVVFVGNVPPGVIRNPRVQVRGGGKFSIDEQARRVHHVARGLRDLGHSNFEAAYDQRSQRIVAEVPRGPGGRLPLAAEVSAAAEARLLDAPGLRHAAKKLDATDLVIEAKADVPPVLDHSRGGAWLQDSSGNNQCTSGWSVYVRGTHGIVTAGHCAIVLAQYQEPGGSAYSMTLQNVADWVYGDVAWYTTTHVEPPEFYASASSIRDVTSQVGAWSLVGSTTCFYGRASNRRHCNYEIESFPVSRDMSGTFPVFSVIDHLVRASNPNEGNNPIVNGDSGGGYSFNFAAHGVHSGRNASYANCGGSGQPACKTFFTATDVLAFGLGGALIRGGEGP